MGGTWAGFSYPVSTVEVTRSNVGTVSPQRQASHVELERKHGPQREARNEDSAAENKRDTPMTVRPRPQPWRRRCTVARRPEEAGLIPNVVCSKTHDCSHLDISEMQMSLNSGRRTFCHSSFLEMISDGAAHLPRCLRWNSVSCDALIP